MCAFPLNQRAVGSTPTRPTNSITRFRLPGLWSRQLVREPNRAAAIDDHHVPYGPRTVTLPKYIEAAFAEQRGRLGCRVGQEWRRGRAGQPSTDELVKIDHPVAVRIIGVRVHIMSVFGQPDDIPNPSRKNRIHDHALLSLKPRPVPSYPLAQLSFPGRAKLPLFGLDNGTLVAVNFHFAVEWASRSSNHASCVYPRGLFQEEKYSIVAIEEWVSKFVCVQ